MYVLDEVKISSPDLYINSLYPHIKELCNKVLKDYVFNDSNSNENKDENSTSNTDNSPSKRKLPLNDLVNLMQICIKYNLLDQLSIPQYSKLTIDLNDYLSLREKGLTPSLNSSYYFLLNYISAYFNRKEKIHNKNLILTSTFPKIPLFKFHEQLFRDKSIQMKQFDGLLLTNETITDVLFKIIKLIKPEFKVLINQCIDNYYYVDAYLPKTKVAFLIQKKNNKFYWNFKTKDLGIYVATDEYENLQSKILLEEFGFKTIVITDFAILYNQEILINFLRSNI